MNVVGIFAGRGDVLMGYALAALVFFFLGWKAKAWKDRLSDKFIAKFGRKTN